MTEQDFYVQCVEKALTFIVGELGEDQSPALNDIAAAAGLSKFHFHRIFRLLTGETVAGTITRLRLARGAGKLQDPGASITDAALEAGYSSSQAFAKVLRRELAESASDLRADPERLAKTLKVLSQPATSNDVDLRVELASLEPFSAIAIRTEGRYPDLNETYYRLFEAAGDPAVVEAILGLAQEDIELADEIA
ncbi:MAG: helix-turn-helix transcriptional regulator, partial [Pseudomonadota bacterium]